MKGQSVNRIFRTLFLHSSLRIKLPDGFYFLIAFLVLVGIAALSPIQAIDPGVKAIVQETNEIIAPIERLLIESWKASAGTRAIMVHEDMADVDGIVTEITELG